MPLFRQHTIFTLLVITLLVTLQTATAHAVHWTEITSTTRHVVALEEDSVNLTPLARLTTWLRFTPLGDTERHAAAAEYGVKGYRYHMEYYEIDCSEQNAVLGLIDIFGTGQARLKRLTGGVKPDLIIPGSVLDKAAQQVCPQLDGETSEDEAEITSTTGTRQSADYAKEKTASKETLLELQGLKKIAEARKDSVEAWRNLGNGYFDADMPEAAIEAYGKVLKLRPDDTDVLNDQGAMYRQIKSFDKALANFEKAYRLNPDNLESLYNQGYLYAFDLNNIPKALELWRRYLERDNISETAQQVRSFVERYGTK